MKSDSVAFGIAGVLFGLIAGWIIGSQQAVVRPSAPAVASPAGLQALGQAMRREQAIGFACLLLLAPVVWGFRRAFARERRR